MYLEKLVITGFKSFKDKTTFNFDKPFTSIVGPNGGGKTNVVDALRWVMGEQALKLIRAKKAEDVIFSGTSKVSRLGMAQVELFLNNEDKRLNLEYPKVVITRKIYRNGESEYIINKSKVRLQDIIMLLAKANFAQKSYGIIGQGMITDILNANPQDRKEFFDDACGVREFQIKRDQAINKLIRCEDNLEKADALMAEIGPRLKSLRRQVAKLEKRKKIEGELEEISIQYYGTSWNRLVDQIKIDNQKKEELNREGGEIQVSITAKETELEKLGMEKSRTESYTALQTENNELQEDKNIILQEQVVLKGKLELEGERAGQTNLIWLSRRADELKRDLEKKDGEVVQIEDIISGLNEKLAARTIDQDLINKDFRDLEYKLLKIKEEMDQMIAVLSVPEIRGTLKEIFVEQESFLKRLLGCNNLEAFQSAQKDAEVVTTHLAELLDNLYEQNDEEIAAKKIEISQLKKSLDQTADQKEKLLQASNDLRIEIQTKKEKINLIAESKNDIENELNKINEELDVTQQELNKELDKESKLLAFQKKNGELDNKIAALEKTMGLVGDKIAKFNEEEEKKKNELLRLQAELRNFQEKLNISNSGVNAIDVNLAKLETRKEDLTSEMDKAMNEEAQAKARKLTELHRNPDTLMIEMEKMKHQLELIGGIDPETLQEHDETEKRWEFLTTQTKDLKKTIMSMDSLIDELDVKIKKQFNEAFKKIAANFSKYFNLIFDGGSAKLSLLMEEPSSAEATEGDSATPEASQESLEGLEKNPSTKIGDFAPLGKKKKRQKIVSGIEIEASPPGKKLKSVHALSGGEKSMTAIAMICSIIDANTPPFVVLDEVEAALDEANAEKFAGIIRHLSKKTQFIVISHNRETMQAADVLYGVTINKEGASSILSVKLAEAEKMTDADQNLTKK
ncbi:AAA family ATPase [Patescibacteria group bacterium]|nr:AAA family ATPase [Patescibacteria group bacterium]MBU1963332.1 AAA family ATPase [Patescibacteria group bacterium]